MSHGVSVLLAGQTQKYLFRGFFHRSCPDVMVESDKPFILEFDPSEVTLGQRRPVDDGLYHVTKLGQQHWVV
jgi:hypothetical protein